MEIQAKGLEHRYAKNTPLERLAISDINIEIKSGSYVAIIGHTGSGKSTLIQHFNGIIKPTSGELIIGEQKIESGVKPKSLKGLRKKVGIVFQYPEHQLFEETIEKDICFGPMNFGVSLEAAKKKARKVLQMVGLSEDLLQRSPFELSGGQMRRVAIAGVLAMNPEVIILDEPTAGLDPKGQKEIMDLFKSLHKERGLTTILVTHSMEDAAKYADEIIVMGKGTVQLQGTPESVFASADMIKNVGLDLPEATQFILKLQERFNEKLPSGVYTLEDAVDVVSKLLNMGEAK
jgi:energy-coupling factor transport system ATP-binding protein